MSEAEHLSEALITLLVRSDNGWFTPFTTVVEGLMVEQALQVPAPGMNCIWAVVNHMRFWNEVILLRLRGLPVNRKALGAENGWPRPGGPGEERATEAPRPRGSCPGHRAVHRPPSPSRPPA